MSTKITADDRVIPGFRKMSKQRILDMARAHINRTRKPSKNIDGVCQYSGSGCNAAPLLVNQYRNNLDVYGDWSELLARQLVPANNSDFIMKLQDAHDDAAVQTVGTFLYAYNDNMEMLAKTYGLNYNPIV